MTRRWKNQLVSYGSLLLFLFLFATEASASAGAETARGLQKKASGSLVDISVANNGATRLSMFDAAGSLVLGSVGPSGQPVFSQPYGPYPGWTPRASADGQDGLTRILWTHDDGSASLWLAEGLAARDAFRYGRVDGLTATDVAAGPGSDAHILWTGIDGATVLQTIDAAGEIANTLSLGPYTGWSAVAIADGQDGLTRLLWRKTDGSVGLSLVSSGGILATFRYQPLESAGAVDLAVGRDGLTRILMAFDDGRVSLLASYETGRLDRYGTTCSTPAGLTAKRVSVGEAGSTRVLLTDSEGDAVLLFLSQGGICEGEVSLAPPAPPANNIAGAWTGTYNSNDYVDCDTSLSLPAQASFEQNGSTVVGTLKATGPCGPDYSFQGSLLGNALTGAISAAPIFYGSARGTLSWPTLEIELVNGYGFIMGQLHLHR